MGSTPLALCLLSRGISVFYFEAIARRDGVILEITLLPWTRPHRSIRRL